MPFCKPSVLCIKQDMPFREQALFRPYLALYKSHFVSPYKTTSGDKDKKLDGNKEQKGSGKATHKE